MGLDLHPLLHRCRTGCHQPFASFHLDNAHPARAGRREFLHAAQGGYHYPVAVERRKDCLSLLRLDALVVYFYGELHGLSYCDSTELTLSLIHISEPTRRTPISYAVFCL